MNADFRMGYPAAGLYSADGTEPAIVYCDTPYPLGTPARVLAERLAPPPGALAYRAELKRFRDFEREVFPEPDGTFTDRLGRRTYLARNPAAATAMMARAFGEVAARRAIQVRRIDPGTGAVSVLNVGGVEIRIIDKRSEPDPVDVVAST